MPPSCEELPLSPSAWSGPLPARSSSPNARAADLMCPPLLPHSGPLAREFLSAHCSAAAGGEPPTRRESSLPTHPVTPFRHTSAPAETCNIRPPQPLDDVEKLRSRRGTWTTHPCGDLTTERTDHNHWTSNDFDPCSSREAATPDTRSSHSISRRAPGLASPSSWSPGAVDFFSLLAST